LQNPAEIQRAKEVQRMSFRIISEMTRISSASFFLVVILASLAVRDSNTDISLAHNDFQIRHRIPSHQSQILLLSLVIRLI
jgi:hypothetical protein